MTRFSAWLSSLRRTLRPRPTGHRRRKPFRPGVEALEGREVPATFTVTNSLDTGAGSLRQAILDADATPNVGGFADRIAFNIPGGNSATIALQSALPDVTEAVLLDGMTQSGSQGTPGIELDGAAVAGDGLVLRDHAGSQVLGLVINRFGGNGILIVGGGTHTVRTNFIGTSFNGLTDLGNGGDGVSILGASNNKIGAFAGNIILFNAGAGVKVVGGTGNTIENFRTFNNDGLGIDLGGDGVTPNDDGDGDTGANNLQNSPVLVSAVANVNGSDTTEIRGTLNSTPNTTFRIRVFSNRAGDPSGFGEGDTARDSFEVTTDAQGVANFVSTLPFRLVRGDIMTATATNEATGDTSEFSNAVTLEASGGVIVGTTFNDANSNGARDAGEAPLGGVTVFLDANGNGQLDAGEASVVTDDAEGEYILVVAQDGPVVVRALVPAGFRQTTADPGPLAVAGGDGFLGGEFGFQALSPGNSGGSISGTKYLDLNANGVIDPGEPGVGGVQIFADLNGNGVIDPGEPGTVSAADGSYTLTFATDGAFLVRETVPHCWFQTSANPGPIAVAGGAAVSGVNFGNLAILPPAVERIVINDGARQRSLVKKITLTFNTLVTLDPAAFRLRKVHGKRVVPHVASAVVGGKTVVTLTFPGKGGSLPDGNFRLLLLADLVRDPFGRALDGNGDGVPGDDRVAKFFRLFGDANGNRAVDGSDLVRFAGAFNAPAAKSKFGPVFDYNGDGVVNVKDLIQFGRRFGTVLPR